MMISHYSKLMMALVVTALLGVSTVFAQSEVIVEWAADDGFTPVKNALRDFIANDTLRPDDRVYLLRRGGFYWNEDRIAWEGFHLHLRGQTADEARPEDNVCGPGGDEDCGPAIIQRVAREDLSVDGVMLQNTGSASDLTIENVWLMGQDDQGGRGAYEQIQLDASDSRFVFDNVIFDRNWWHFLGPNSTGCDMWITNSTFRNLFGPNQQWEGLGFRFEVGADTVVIENNTFLNIGFTPFQSEAAPMEYFVVNHNTFVNVGRNFSAGSLWKEAYIANNLFVNPYWYGQQPSEYEDPDAVDEYDGFFSIAELPAAYGTDFDRRIVVVNNSFWRDDGYAAMMGDTVRHQPFINDTTANYFAAWDAMVFEDNYDPADPGLANYAELEPLIPLQVASILSHRAAQTVDPENMYYYDPGRDEECLVCNIWPLPEDFTYSNADLLDGGTDGLALGDLNWYPDDYAAYMANRDQYVSDIIARAGERVTLNIEATAEADAGELSGDAEVLPAEGFTYFSMDGSGFIQWDFDLPADGTYDLVVHTHLRNNPQRGQRIIVNGTGIRNNEGFGEYYWDVATGVPQDDWFFTHIKQAELIEGADALNMTAGDNTIRIEPSWGWQRFASIALLDAASGDTTLVLDAPAATSELVNPVCEESPWCPTGFNAVALGAGGAVTWNLEFPGTGDYMVRVFFQTDAGAMGSLSLDGAEVVSGINFEAGEEGGDLFSDIFTAEAGKNAARALTLSSSSGGLNVDYVQLISFSTPTAAEPNELPEGYALEQNYPNPFNPVTNISFTLGDPGDVSLIVYDVMGRQVAKLIDGQLSSGTYNVSWDATGDEVTFASGVYFYRLQTPVGYMVKKMVLMK